jgi:hypothetical protein
VFISRFCRQQCGCSVTRPKERKKIPTKVAAQQKGAQQAARWYCGPKPKSVWRRRALSVQLGFARPKSGTKATTPGLAAPTHARRRGTILCGDRTAERAVVLAGARQGGSWCAGRPIGAEQSTGAWRWRTAVSLARRV